MKKLTTFHALVVALGVVALVAATSCTRIKHKAATSCTKIWHKLVDKWEESTTTEEYSIETLYPALDGQECIGVRGDGLLYYYWFRYKATPAEVEAALMARPCTYSKIVPDSTLKPCDKTYIEDNFYSLLQDSYPVFTEWKTAPEDHLQYYCCTRTPLSHLLVFDTVTGYVYHYIGEFRE